MTRSSTFRTAGGLALATLALALAPTSASAFAIESFTTTTSTAQAAGHPDLSVGLTFPIKEPYPGVWGNDGHLKSAVVDLPAGLSGDPNVVPHCTNQQAEASTCPPASQVGTLRVRLEYNTTDPSAPDTNLGPVYLAEPLPGETARLVSPVAGFVPVHISITPRSDGDFGLRAKIDGLPGVGTSPNRVLMTLWGVPADSSHDLERLDQFGGPLTYDENYNALPTTSPLQRRPFLTNGTACGPQAPATASARSFETPDAESTATAALPELTGCDQVPFKPTASVRAEQPEPDSPSAVSVDLDVPQVGSPDSPAASHVKRVSITLPPGLVISPAGAQGLEACSDEQLQLGTLVDATCPAASRIGSARFDVPVLPGPLEGGVYLRKPEPGRLFRLALIASGYGVKLKITGEATPDPVTGQLTAVFDNAPQQPFSSLRLRFDGGARAPLATPQDCGTGAATGTILGWSGALATVGEPFTVSAAGGAACPARGFAPTLRAGTSRPAAGAASPLVVEIGRRDGEQTLRRIDVQLPSGVTAKVSSAPRCSAAEGQAGTCGEASRIGSTTVAAGSGSQPLFLGGRVYLTEGYGGAPYGMSIVVPAKVGPFDLGDVVVPARVFVDRTTAQLRVVSEDLPTIVQGIPLRIKEVRINVDRPGFVLNPTRCDQQRVTATLLSAEGGSASASTPFAVGGCKALAFKPALTAQTGGKRRKGSGASLTVKIASPVGGANLSRVVVRLPRRLSARGTTINKACLAEQWAAGTCPASTRAGTATAVTPILPAPLEAGVYFVARPRGEGKLPQLRMVLRGNGLEIDLTGELTIGRDGFTTATFAGIPDVPISTFEMVLPQGPNSLLEVSGGSLCQAPSFSMRTELVAQTGARVKRLQKIAVTGCKAAKSNRRTKASPSRAR